MPKRFVIAFIATIILSTPLFAMANEGHSGNCASCHTLTIKEASELLKATGGTVKSVKQAPVKGLFELLIEKDGNQGIIFLDYSKKNLLQGLIVNLDSLQPISAHEMPKAKEVTSLDPKTIPVEGAVVMGNPKGTKKLYVFTDPDCPYCRKFHANLKELEKIAPDVAIYIMFYPLPMHPGAFDKARAVLEAGTREMLDKAFEGKDVPNPAKDSSKAAIESIVRFANSNGISATPTLVMPDGTIVVGGKDAKMLKEILEGVKKQ